MALTGQVDMPILEMRMDVDILTKLVCFGSLDTDHHSVFENGDVSPQKVGTPVVICGCGKSIFTCSQESRMKAAQKSSIVRRQMVLVG